MSNIIFVGDTHLKGSSPISRCDDYSTAILNKIESLVQVANSFNCNKIVLLGDVFDSHTTTLPYLAKVISSFKKISDAGITVYTVVGNHDIKNNRMDSLSSCALGILISTGYVKLAPRTLTIDDVDFNFFHYPDELVKRDSDNYSVCVAHRYYEFGLSWDSLTRDDVKSLNYDAMILGHYHVPCDTVTIEDTLLYRPGSLSRSTSESYNKLRTPRVLIFNCLNHKTAYVDIQCESADKVFTTTIEQSNHICFSMKDLVKFITSSYTSSDLNIRDYFAQLNIPYDCRVKISDYLDNIGA
jgi:DNA repair exonuclease SbcCD nuclease subunit